MRGSRHSRRAGIGDNERAAAYGSTPIELGPQDEVLLRLRVQRPTSWPAVDGTRQLEPPHTSVPHPAGHPAQPARAVERVFEASSPRSGGFLRQCRAFLAQSGEPEPDPALGGAERDVLLIGDLAGRE